MPKVYNGGYKDEDAWDRLQGAIYLVKSGICPTVGPLLDLFRYIESTVYDTLAVSHKTMVFYYNADFIMGRTRLKLTPRELVVGVMHEVGHIILDHGERRGNRNARAASGGCLWNHAGDREINKGLRDLTYTKPDGTVIPLDMPSWALFPEQIGAPSAGPAATAEVYYKIELHQNEGGGTPPPPKKDQPRVYEVGDEVKPRSGPNKGKRCIVTKVTKPDVQGRQIVEYEPI